MASNVEMKACPHCGTLLLASLVDAINNPTQPESCPRFSEVKSIQDKFPEWTAAAQRLADFYARSAPFAPQEIVPA